MSDLRCVCATCDHCCDRCHERATQEDRLCNQCRQPSAGIRAAFAHINRWKKEGLVW